MQKKNVVICGAKRSAIGNFGGSLASLKAQEIASHVIKDLMAKADLKDNEVDEVIMGHVLTAGCGQNAARQAALAAGVSIEVPAWEINQVCGSGLRAIAVGYQQILMGYANIIISGGLESMSNAPHLLHLRQGKKMGDAKLIDSMIYDGLRDAIRDYHMGITAENIAEKYNISRQQQDEFALNSQTKAAKAKNSNKFKDEIVQIKISTGSGVKAKEFTFETDEFIRDDTDINSLSKLKPAFSSEGTVTAGNASGINDGAAAVLLMYEEEAEARGLKPMAKIISFAQSGVAPELMGLGPIQASKKALEIAEWSVDDLDIIELNEAFAAQAIAVNQEMGWDTKKVNVNGGAIALGHPIGASGARIVVTMLHEMQRSKLKRGLATLCIGGGMGAAMCFESM